MGMLKKEKTRIVSLAVFAVALVMILINLVSLVFPSLIVTFTDDSGFGGEPFELGSWAIPLIVTNIAVLIFGILYITKRLPSFVHNSINFIKNFEISRNVASIVIVGIVFGYIGFAIPELPADEGRIFGDFERVKQVVENWPFEGVVGEEPLFNLHVKKFSSQIISVSLPEL